MDFERRIALAERDYHTIEDEETFIKVVNIGEKLVVNRIDGYELGRVVFFLMNLRIHKQSVYLTRHGESEFNVEGKIGGDSSLSPNGIRYAQELSLFIDEEQKTEDLPIVVWCSTLKRTIQTASFIGGPRAI